MVGAGQKPNIPTAMSQMRLSVGGVIQAEATSTSSTDGIGAAAEGLVEMAGGAELQGVSADQHNLNGMNPDGDGGLKGGSLYGRWGEFSFSGLPWMKLKGGGLEPFDYAMGMKNQTLPIYSLSTKFSWTAALNIGLKGGDEGDGVLGGQAVTSSDNQQQATEDPTPLPAPAAQQSSNQSFASMDTASDADVAGQVQAGIELIPDLSTLQPSPNSTTSSTSGSTITFVTGPPTVQITQATLLPPAGFPENVPAQEAMQQASGQQTQSDLSMEPSAPKTKRGQSSLTMTFSQLSLGIATATTTINAPQFVQSNPIAVTAESFPATSTTMGTLTTVGHVQQNLIQEQAASLLNTVKVEHPLFIQLPNLVSSCTTVPAQVPQSAVSLPSKSGQVGAQPPIIMQPSLANQSPSGISGQVSIYNPLMVPTGAPVSIPIQAATSIQISPLTVAESGTISKPQSVVARMTMPIASSVVRPQMPEMRYNTISQPGASLLSATQPEQLSGLHTLAAVAAASHNIQTPTQGMKVLSQAPAQQPMLSHVQVAKVSGVLTNTLEAQPVELSGLHTLAEAAAAAPKIQTHTQGMEVVSQAPAQQSMLSHVQVAKVSGVLTNTLEAQPVELSGLNTLAEAAAAAQEIQTHTQRMKVLTQVPGQLPLFSQVKAAKVSGGTAGFGSPVTSLLTEAATTVETTRISSIKKDLLSQKPGTPEPPSSIEISKSVDGVTIAWEHSLNTPGDILEYSVYLAVKLPANAPEPKPGVTNHSFVRVYCGPSNQCNVPTASLNRALVDTTSEPAIIFRIAAKNDKGYGPATQVRWLQESAVPNFSTPKTGILKRPAPMPPTVLTKRGRTDM